jgi:DNA-binding NarL/FixJ family response regulator
MVSTMRFVLCDDDEMLCSMVDATVATHGHDVVGIADNTVAGVGLVEHGQPDVVVVDPTVGCNSDFDVIDTAIAVGARVIVFSRSGEAPASGRYVPEPLFVAKPDLWALEQAIGRLSTDPAQEVAEADRRHRPTRAPSGPPPSGPRDAAAFYSALNESVEGDAFINITTISGGTAIDLPKMAGLVSDHIRETDRLLMLITTSSLLVLLLGGGEAGVESVFNRVHKDTHLPANIEFRSVVLAAGEIPADAFDRLKRGGDSVRS